MSSPLYINVGNLLKSNNKLSICTTKCSLTFNYLPNIPISIGQSPPVFNPSILFKTPTPLLIHTVLFSPSPASTDTSGSTTSTITTDSSTSASTSTSPSITEINYKYNAPTSQTLSNIYIGGNTSNPFSLESLYFITPPINNYSSTSSGSGSSSSTTSNKYNIIGEIYIKHVYLNSNAYIIIPISGLPGTATSNTTNLETAINPGTEPSSLPQSINLYNIFNAIQVKYSNSLSSAPTSLFNNYPYFKWNSYDLFSSSSSTNSPSNSTYFLINPAYTIKLPRLATYLIDNHHSDLPSPLKHPPTTFPSSVLGSTDPFIIINNNPSSKGSSTSPYYMVCQSSNYSDATKSVTVKPKSVIQKMITDSQSYFNSKFVSSVDSTVWNIIYNVIITVVIIVFLIFLFTKLGAYMNSNQDTQSTQGTKSTHDAQGK